MALTDAAGHTTGSTTPPTVLADPIDEHRLPESDDPPTGTERDDLARALLDSWADDRNVLTAYRAGWDRGVTDHAAAISEQAAGDRLAVAQTLRAWARELRRQPDDAVVGCRAVADTLDEQIARLTAQSGR